MTHQLIKGWWAVRDAVQWKEPMFELSDEIIQKVDDDDVYELGDGTKGFSLGSKSFIIAETKDELKSYVIGELFLMEDHLDAEIAKLMQRKLENRNTLNKVAGD